MRSSALATLLLLAAACGPALSPVPRAAVPAVDPVSGALSAVEVELPGCELANVRGPAGALLVGASLDLDSGRAGGGASPDCQLRRTQSGAAAATSTRCASLLGAYAALERARAFLLSAGAEALVPAAVLADPRLAEAQESAQGELTHGLGYLPQSDSFTLVGGPAGARVPAALNPGAVTREVARRQLRGLLETHPDDAEGVALFLGAAASGDPGYLAASEPLGDPRGELDLARPLSPGAPAASVVAGALWAWADASGDTVSAARAALAAARALSSSRAEPGALLSLVAEQLDGAERDQACAVFRARAGRLPACP
jgi:hypothetical protein